jgi:hypothetical protein
LDALMRDATFKSLRGYSKTSSRSSSKFKGALS